MSARLSHQARIYARLQLLHLRAHLEYEADFWIGIVGMALTHLAGFVFVWVLFSSLPAVGGWTLWEVAVLYALAIIPRGLVDLVCDGPWRLRQLVNSGELDRILVRPVSPVLQVFTQSCGMHGFGTVLLGAALLMRATGELRLAWGAGEWALLTATLLSGVILLGSINLATNSIAFWEPSGNSAFPFMVQYLAEFAKFPLTIYGRFVQVLLTWVVPFGLVTYYPSTVLLGRPDAHLWLGWLAPLAGPAMAIVAGTIWRSGLGRYQGAGH